jgi:hypothetical protein
MNDNSPIKVLDFLFLIPTERKKENERERERERERECLDALAMFDVWHRCIDIVQGSQMDVKSNFAVLLLMLQDDRNLYYSRPLSPSSTHAVRPPWRKTQGYWKSHCAVINLSLPELE